MFNWLRKKVTDAILGGVSDALDVIEREDGPPVLVQLPAGLAARLKALPGPAGGAGVDPPHDAEAEGNGRKKGKVTT